MGRPNKIGKKYIFKKSFDSHDDCLNYSHKESKSWRWPASKTKKSCSICKRNGNE